MKRAVDSSSPSAAERPAKKSAVPGQLSRRTFPRKDEQSAQDEFFGTVELMEKTLGKMPIFDILRSLRTSKAFNTVFHGSNVLKALLNPPACVSGETWYLYDMGALNPIILRNTASFEEKFCRFYGWDHAQLRAFRRPFNPVSPNPLLVLPLNGEEQGWLFHGRLQRGGKHYPDSTSATIQLSDPPIRAFRITRTLHSKNSMIRNPNGVTMGDIVSDIAKKGPIVYAEPQHWPRYSMVDRAVVEAVLDKGEWYNRRPERMPVEIWENIADFLSDEDLESLSLTCRKLQSAPSLRIKVTD